MVRLLVKSGADIDALNEYGASSLLSASMNGNSEMVSLLLELGANPLIKDSNGRSIGERLLYAGNFLDLYPEKKRKLAEVLALLGDEELSAALLKEMNQDISILKAKQNTPEPEFTGFCFGREASPLESVLLTGKYDVAAALAADYDNFGSVDCLYFALQEKNQRKEIFDFLEQHNLFDISLSGTMVGKLLVRALNKKNSGALTFLFQRGAKLVVEVSKGRTITVDSVQDPNVQYLLQTGVQAGGKWQVAKRLSVQVERHDLDTIVRHVKNGASMELIDDQGRTPLSDACSNKQNVKIPYDVVEFLLKNGADVHSKGWLRGSTPIHNAVESEISKERVQLTNILLNAGADINARDKNGETPLFAAVKANNVDMVRFLLENGADPAISAAWYSSVETPLSHAVNSYIETGGRRQSLHNLISILKLLIQYGARVETIPEESPEQVVAVLESVLHNQAKDKKVSPESPLPRDSLLFTAVAANSVKSAEEALSRGDDINNRNTLGRTPLHLAAGHGFVEMVDFLLEHGADLFAEDDQYTTPLDQALRNNHSQVVRHLLIFGNGQETSAGSGRSRGSYGLRELSIAASGCQAESVALLVENGVPVEDERSIHRTPLSSSIHEECHEITQYLLAKGANINAKGGSSGNTLLGQAIVESLRVGTDFSFVRILVEVGADVDTFINIALDGNDQSKGLVPENKEKIRSALSLACQEGYLSLVKFLVENGADVNSVDYQHHTPLWYAKQNGNPQVIHFLKKYGASVNAEAREYLYHNDSFLLKGTSFVHKGEYTKALNLFQDGLEKFKKKKNSAGEADALAGLSLVYSRLGQFDKALQMAEASLTAAERDLFNYSGKALALHNLGALYQHKGHLDSSIHFFQKALHFKELSGGEGKADIYHRLGLVYADLNDFNRAVVSLRTAMAMYQENEQEKKEIAMLNSFGEVYQLMNKKSDAYSAYKSALCMALQNSPYDFLWEIYANLMLLHEEKGNVGSAIFFGKQAVNSIQTLRGNVAGIGKEIQQSFMEDKEYLYQKLAALLIEQGRLTEAQQVLGMLKEEEFYNSIRRNEKDKDVLTIKAEFDVIEQSVADRIEEFVRSASWLKSQKENCEELDAYLDEVSSILDKRQWGGGNNEQPAQLQKIRKFLRKSGPDTASLHYLISAEKVHAILTTEEIQVARKTSISIQELSRKIQIFRDILQSPGTDAKPMAEELYTILLKPIAADIENAHIQKLALSLYGMLRYLPVAALYDGEAYMAEKYQMTLFTAGSTTSPADRSAGMYSVAGLGVSQGVGGMSPLPSVPSELDGIIRLQGKGDNSGVLPGAIHLNSDFTKKTMQGSLNDTYSIMHVASHFIVNAGDIANSYLLLGDGGKLSLAAIHDENFDFSSLELLTLSACNTAIAGYGANGAEVESFGALAQKQGAHGVMATLWPVADLSTSIFMKDFYSNLSKPGTGKAQALQRTQISFIDGQMKTNGVSGKNNMENRGRLVPAAHTKDSLLQSPVENRYSHPYYWAPFILMGN